MKLAFIGAGKMATALAVGLIKNNVLQPENMVAGEISKTAGTAFSQTTGITVTSDNVEAIAQADIVILSVKPQVAEDVLVPLAGRLEGKLLLSIAAGLSISRISSWISSQRIIRVMPNTPAMVGLGASVFSCGPAATDTDRDSARMILSAVGVVHEMPEKHLDAVTGLSGSGPAYVFEFVQALADAGTAVGLEPGAALELVVQTIAGAAEMLKRQLGTPEQLRIAVTSPGGTTAAGLAVLKQANFRELIKNVVEQATERSRELGRD